MENISENYKLTIMKDLSIEQKAKRYDEALKVLHKYDGANIMFSQSLKEEIFPELAESEDERTWIINYLNNRKLNSSIIAEKENLKKAIAWLEKQGESYTKRDVDDAYLKGVTDTKKEIEKQYEANYQTRKDIATFIFNYKGDIKDRAKWMDYLGIKVSFVEKQGEQKPAWSEEDERFKIERKAILNDVIAHLRFLASIEKDKVSANYIQRDIDWIKENLPFLRPQNTWKPSDEQMAAISTAINVLGKGTLNGKQLIELQEQLKKLRGE